LLVPALIFFVCFGGGVFIATRWLPDLAVGPVGGMAYFVVCGLIGAALGLLGLRVFLIVEQLKSRGFGSFGDLKATLLAEGLATILFESGLVLGTAAIVYLLAPSREQSNAAPTGSPGSSFG
jgi:hypothetical protein